MSRTNNQGSGTPSPEPVLKTGVSLSGTPSLLARSGSQPDPSTSVRPGPPLLPDKQTRAQKRRGPRATPLKVLRGWVSWWELPSRSPEGGGP